MSTIDKILIALFALALAGGLIAWGLHASWWVGLAALIAVAILGIWSVRDRKMLRVMARRETQLLDQQHQVLLGQHQVQTALTQVVEQQREAVARTASIASATEQINVTVDEVAGQLTQQGGTAQDRHDQVLKTVQDGTQHLDRQARNHVNNINRRLGYAREEIEAQQYLQRRIDTGTLWPSTGGWALDARSAVYLLDLLDQARPQHIVELGSGTTTLLFGHYLTAHGGRLYSFDHLNHYRDLTASYVSLHGLEPVVDLQLAPLAPQVPAADTEPAEDAEPPQWYDLSQARLPEQIDLLFVDGPPAATGPQARYPALNALADRLAPGAVVILDDGVRDEEQQIATRWAQEHPELVREAPDLTAMIVLRKKG
ncbi:class I SAM-dependent methyltransferase [Auritidibacter ignavus]|uniref:class I SAM-dependent methyltransferase n=1 Tax=Auritidibacter ignavus TaxID=678932 RepID=UPI0024B98DA7|nr:class I SAM-dependent methyltransferase [Auritidibacter ignavus]WHS27169.1 class I SAM-dependent methyltransferase [Auritidibacter ignavus]